MAQASRLRSLVSSLICLSVAWLSVQGRADAQVTLNRYHPAPWNFDGFMLSRPERPGHLTFGAQLQLDYAHEPLVWLRDVTNPDAGSYDVVSEQLALHPGIWLALFDRVLLYMQMPLNAVVSQGDDLPAGTAAEYRNFATIGAYVLGARVNVLGDHGSPGTLGIQASLGLPLGKWVGGVSTSFVSETTISGQVALLGELHIHPRFRLGANLGMLFRKRALAQNLELGDELLLAIGAAAMLHKDESTTIEMLVELFGNTVLPNVFSKEATPIEALIGLKAHFANGWSGGLGGDLGLTGGYGSPNYRLIAMLGWALLSKPDDPDYDRDGIENSSDRCPRSPEDKRGPDVTDGCPLADADGDGDGVYDDKDRCLDRAEDGDNFDDDDGCPDEDNDGDGLLDASDKCPDRAEDPDDYEDEDGCPDPDNDGDTVLDVDDKCPREAEDKDSYQDQDGCPDPDNDGDGIVDAADSCPNEAESKNGVDDEDGCPDLVRFAGTQIMTLRPIHFETNSAIIKSDSESILQEMAAVITNHEEIEVLSIDGHTDATGIPAKNLKLSQDRAESVRAFLIGLGIPAERLIAKGYGDTQPIADNKTSDGRTKNRRVEFNIVSAR